MRGVCACVRACVLCGGGGAGPNGIARKCDVTLATFRRGAKGVAFGPNFIVGPTWLNPYVPGSTRLYRVGCYSATRKDCSCTVLVRRPVLLTEIDMVWFGVTPPSARDLSCGVLGYVLGVSIERVLRRWGGGFNVAVEKAAPAPGVPGVRGGKGSMSCHISGALKTDGSLLGSRDHDTIPSQHVLLIANACRLETKLRASAVRSNANLTFQSIESLDQVTGEDLDRTVAVVVCRMDTLPQPLLEPPPYPTPCHIPVLSNVTPLLQHRIDSVLLLSINRQPYRRSPSSPGSSPRRRSRGFVWCRS